MNPQPKRPVDNGNNPERRDLKRIPFESNALVRLAEYLTFRARLRNISADAVQVLCDPRYALLIHPGGTDEVPDASRLIDISVSLPENDTTTEFKACCRVKYCVPAADDQMVLGMQFVSMDFHSVQQLDRFMESQPG
jgi:hypothetical protein